MKALEHQSVHSYSIWAALGAYLFLFPRHFIAPVVLAKGSSDNISSTDRSPSPTSRQLQDNIRPPTPPLLSLESLKILTDFVKRQDEQQKLLREQRREEIKGKRTLLGPQLLSKTAVLSTAPQPHKARRPVSAINSSSPPPSRRLTASSSTTAPETEVCFTYFKANHLDCTRNKDYSVNFQVASASCVASPASCAECGQTDQGYSTIAVCDQDYSTLTTGAQCAYSVMNTCSEAVVDGTGKLNLLKLNKKYNYNPPLQLPPADHPNLPFHLSGVTRRLQSPFFHSVGFCSEATTSEVWVDTGVFTKCSIPYAIDLGLGAKKLNEIKKICSVDTPYAGYNLVCDTFVLTDTNQPLDGNLNFKILTKFLPGSFTNNVLKKPIDFTKGTDTAEACGTGIGTVQSVRLYARHSAACPRVSIRVGQRYVLASNEQIWWVASVHGTAVAKKLIDVHMCGPQRQDRVCDGGHSSRTKCDQERGVCVGVDTVLSPPMSEKSKQETKFDFSSIPTYCLDSATSNAVIPGDTITTGLQIRFGSCEDRLTRDTGAALFEKPQAKCFADLPGCSDSCPTAKNGVCEDGGVNQNPLPESKGGYSYYKCPLGTDCTDCGPTANLWRRVLKTDFAEQPFYSSSEFKDFLQREVFRKTIGSGDGWGARVRFCPVFYNGLTGKYEDPADQAGLTSPCFESLATLQSDALWGQEHSWNWFSQLEQIGYNTPVECGDYCLAEHLDFETNLYQSLPRRHQFRRNKNAAKVVQLGNSEVINLEQDLSLEFASPEFELTSLISDNQAKLLHGKQTQGVYLSGKVSDYGATFAAGSKYGVDYKQQTRFLNCPFKASYPPNGFIQADGSLSKDRFPVLSQGMSYCAFDKISTTGIPESATTDVIPLVGVAVDVSCAHDASDLTFTTTTTPSPLVDHGRDFVCVTKFAKIPGDAKSAEDFVEPCSSNQKFATSYPVLSGLDAATNVPKCDLTATGSDIPVKCPNSRCNYEFLFGINQMGYSAAWCEEPNFSRCTIGEAAADCFTAAKAAKQYLDQYADTESATLASGADLDYTMELGRIGVCIHQSATQYSMRIFGHCEANRNQRVASPPFHIGGLKPQEFTVGALTSNRLETCLPACSDSCPSALNGICEDGGENSVAGVGVGGIKIGKYSGVSGGYRCPLGTDCSDCGVRERVWHRVYDHKTDSTTQNRMSTWEEVIEGSSLKEDHGSLTQTRFRLCRTTGGLVGGGTGSSSSSASSTATTTDALDCVESFATVNLRETIVEKKSLNTVKSKSGFCDANCLRAHPGWTSSTLQADFVDAAMLADRGPGFQLRHNIGRGKVAPSVDAAYPDRVFEPWINRLSYAGVLGQEPVTNGIWQTSGNILGVNCTDATSSSSTVGGGGGQDGSSERVGECHFVDNYDVSGLQQSAASYVERRSYLVLDVSCDIATTTTTTTTILGAVADTTSTTEEAGDGVGEPTTTKPTTTSTTAVEQETTQTPTTTEPPATENVAIDVAMSLDLAVIPVSAEGQAKVKAAVGTATGSVFCRTFQAMWLPEGVQTSTQAEKAAAAKLCQQAQNGGSNPEYTGPSVFWSAEMSSTGGPPGFAEAAKPVQISFTSDEDEVAARVVVPSTPVGDGAATNTFAGRRERRLVEDVVAHQLLEKERKTTGRSATADVEHNKADAGRDREVDSTTFLQEGGIFKHVFENLLVTELRGLVLDDGPRLLTTASSVSGSLAFQMSLTAPGASPALVQQAQASQTAANNRNVTNALTSQAQLNVASAGFPNVANAVAARAVSAVSVDGGTTITTTLAPSDPTNSTTGAGAARGTNNTTDEESDTLVVVVICGFGLALLTCMIVPACRLHIARKAQRERDMVRIAEVEEEKLIRLKMKASVGTMDHVVVQGVEVPPAPRLSRDSRATDSARRISSSKKSSLDNSSVEDRRTSVHGTEAERHWQSFLSDYNKKKSAYKYGMKWKGKIRATDLQKAGMKNSSYQKAPSRFSAKEVSGSAPVQRPSSGFNAEEVDQPHHFVWRPTVEEQEPGEQGRKRRSSTTSSSRSSGRAAKSSIIPADVNDFWEPEDMHYKKSDMRSMRRSQNQSKIEAGLFDFAELEKDTWLQRGGPDVGFYTAVYQRDQFFSSVPENSKHGLDSHSRHFWRDNATTTTDEMGKSSVNTTGHATASNYQKISRIENSTAEPPAPISVLRATAQTESALGPFARQGSGSAGYGAAASSISRGSDGSRPTAGRAEVEEEDVMFRPTARRSSRRASARKSAAAQEQSQQAPAGTSGRGFFGAVGNLFTGGLFGGGSGTRAAEQDFAAAGAPGSSGSAAVELQTQRRSRRSVQENETSSYMPARSGAAGSSSSSPARVGVRPKEPKVSDTRPKTYEKFSYTENSEPELWRPSSRNQNKTVEEGKNKQDLLQVRTKQRADAREVDQDSTPERSEDSDLWRPSTGAASGAEKKIKVDVLAQEEVVLESSPNPKNKARQVSSDSDSTPQTSLEGDLWRPSGGAPTPDGHEDQNSTRRTTRHSVRAMENPVFPDQDHHTNMRASYYQDALAGAAARASVASRASLASQEGEALDEFSGRSDDLLEEGGEDDEAEEEVESFTASSKVKYVQQQEKTEKSSASSSKRAKAPALQEMQPSNMRASRRRSQSDEEQNSRTTRRQKNERSASNNSSAAGRRGFTSSATYNSSSAAEDQDEYAIVPESRSRIRKISAGENGDLAVRPLQRIKHFHRNTQVEEHERRMEELAGSTPSSRKNAKRRARLNKNTTPHLLAKARAANQALR
ncbi:unnamed protein product [Amoebophrya sp. A120]|nr:unnamed protein product [Amoebophrya sp. A120]|eukprot:GSA120T00000206001.1